MPDAPQLPEQVPPLTSLYLARLECENFRSCKETTVDLKDDLTILVGENNSGKSNIIDAIRLATHPANGRRTRYFEDNDATRDSGSTKISIKTIYSKPSPSQLGMYYHASDIQSGDCYYGVSFDCERLISGKLARPTFSAGATYAKDSEPEARERIRHVYLAPLRDAQKELDSADSNRFLAIIEQLATKEQRAELLELADRNMTDLQDHEAVKGPASKINDHISELTNPVRKQTVEAKFTGFRLRQLIRSLRLKMAEQGVELADLQDSGLGYANLLYIAAVLLELINADEAELTIFLVEEPEAHLHPQLQTVLLDYLRQQAKKSLRNDATKPAGRIQVVCTTHSTTLASSVPVENVVVVRSNIDGAPDRHTKVIPIEKLGINDSQRGKITRMLDATKASLLFARRLVLVEGLAEQLLVPVFAKKVLGEGHSKFSGVTTIAIGGVDFAPYVELLLKKHDGVAIVDHLIVITDLDPAEDGTVPVNRENILKAAARAITAENELSVFLSDFTLEADLFGEAGNKALLKSAYLEQRPQSAAKWDAIAADAQPVKKLHDAMREANFLGKGEFAQYLASKIPSNVDFVVPLYLRNAIEKAVSIGVVAPANGVN